MPNLSPEFMMASAVTDPTKLIAAIPAGIVGATAAAKTFTIVHQSEMGVRTRRGAPMIKQEIYDRVTQEICDELPERRINCRSQIRQLPATERRDRIREKLLELPEEVQEDGIYRIVGQGLVWLTPFIDSVVKINVTDQTTAIKPFEIETQDDRQMIISPSITWNVRHDKDNPYKALFNINNEKDAKLKTKTQELEQTVSWICLEGLGLVLRGRTYDGLKNFDPEEVTTRMREVCEEGLNNYGVNLGAVRLAPNVRAPAERLSQAIESSPDPSKAGIISASTSEGEGARIIKLVSPPEETA